METLRLALRFRDAITDIDTIIEHRKVITERGHVFWGWWKKKHEEQDLSLIESLSYVNDYLLIIDTTTKRSFKAKISKVVEKNSHEIDRECIPEYYRDDVDKVEAWFVINNIEVIDFDPDLEKRIGENTIYIFDNSNVMQNESNKLSSKTSEKNSILQLSDLHFGKDYSFKDSTQDGYHDLNRKTLSACLIKDLKSLNLVDEIQAIIITGDITTQGDWSSKTIKSIQKELLAICKGLKISILDVYFVPGNHDIVRYDEGKDNSTKLLDFEHEQPFRIFLANLQDKKISEPLNYLAKISLKNCDIQLCLLNSCSIVSIPNWTEYGYVGHEGGATLEALGELAVERPTYRMMALHHHLLPVTQIDNLHEKGVSLTLDAVELLDIAASVKVGIALHGHQHLARVVNYQKVPEINDINGSNPITIISGGSSGVNSSRRIDSMSNSYSVITFGQNKPRLKIREINSDGKRGNTIYDCDLNVEALS